MSEVRLFRTLGVPLAVAFIFLVFTPKLCEKAIVDAQKRKALTATATTSTGATATTPAPSGLVISSSTPAPILASSLHFPAGLDMSRVQYLVEIDSTFSAPLTMAVTESAPITPLLVDRQYVDKSLAPTSEGLINVNGAVQTPDGWTIPIAKRKFVGIDGIEDAGDNRYQVAVKWRWEPTAVAAPLLPRPQDHHLKGEFAGGPRDWVLARYVEPPDTALR